MGLFIFVEGLDDERFFRKVIVPLFRCEVRIIKWRRMKKEKISDYIKSVEGMGAEYIFVTDINDSRSAEEKVKKIKKMIRNIREERVAVVVKEIESWYLAGLDEGALEELGLRMRFERTDNITKEEVERMIPERLKPRSFFLNEILKRFSVDVAARRNTSFKDFMRRFVK